MCGLLLVVWCAGVMLYGAVAEAPVAPTRGAPPSDAFLIGRGSGMVWSAVLLLVGLRTMQYGLRRVHPASGGVVYAPAKLLVGLSLLGVGGVLVLDVVLAGQRVALAPDAVDVARNTTVFGAVLMAAGAMLTFRGASHLSTGRGRMP